MINIIKSIVVMALLVGFSFNVLAGQDQPQMFLETESPKSFLKTVKTFKKVVNATAGWSILNTTNMGGILSAKGYTTAPVLIFDLCSGKYSAQILAKDEYRVVSPLMPCRISIYKTSKGKVIIARLNARGMAPMFNKDLAKIMVKSGDELEVIIKKTISRLKKAK